LSRAFVCPNTFRMTAWSGKGGPLGPVPGVEPEGAGGVGEEDVVGVPPGDPDNPPVVDPEGPGPVAPDPDEPVGSETSFGNPDGFPLTPFCHAGFPFRVAPGFFLVAIKAPWMHADHRMTQNHPRVNKSPQERFYGPSRTRG
jgi:hypothetical protein